MKHRRKTRNRRYNRNREWNQNQHTFALTAKAAIGIVAVVLLTTGYLCLRHRNETLLQKIATEESRLEVLRIDLEREEKNWNTLCTQRNISSALRANGIAMYTPNARQYIVKSKASIDPSSVHEKNTAVAYHSVR